ncbi:carboxypeptidase-like regulatory domain-containing protein [Pontibacter akesuensis]|uniref:Uncharacterized protein n=1 Tax=Pontibacter akesuensis TaxID=388950 RepID=A0A1I7KLA4_9BACT|nr:carboxypeptidase-like regulatory domain-containing protein [Pontibacter akesuensis]GHA77970.1 hypothetical protein GCM10007389_34770 [Pontibacter akesuensis]SFU98229.1 hypothetical protein SAMN04487941_3832 [Pontibacter akesuensis]
MKTPRLFLQLCVLLGIGGIAFLLTGCREYPNDYISKYCPGSCTVIKGRVSTNNGSVPVAGATLRVQVDTYTEYGSGIRNKAIATTDANGNYELRFLMRDDELQIGVYHILTDLDPNQYISCQPLDFIPASSLARDTVIINNYTVAPSASINLQLVNEELMQPDERLYATFKYKLVPADTDSCTFVLDVRQAYLQNILALPANSPIAVRLEKTKAGVTTTEKDVLALQPGEERLYEITF